MKTPKDIKEAVDLGLHMNLDNELEVIAMVKDIENVDTHPRSVLLLLTWLREG